MAHYGGGPRFTRPLSNERPGPRFIPPQNRNVPRAIFNDPRPSLTPRPNKPTSETPSTSSSPSIRNQNTASSTDSSTDSPNKTQKPTTSESSSTEPSFESTDTKTITKSETTPSDDEQRTTSSTGMKRPRADNNSQVQSTEKKPTQGGRCRLFIGNIPSDLTQEEFQLLFGKYGELVEYFVNPSRGFGFIKLSSRHTAEQAKYDLDGYVLRGKPLRIRFASQGATIKVKNLSGNVSNELLKDAFEQCFGAVERAVVIVDDRGKSTGEGIVEFEKKPSAQKCLNDCTERCFFITSELRPVIVEPWDIRDDEDGLPEKSLVRNPAYTKEREGKPHFAELGTIEHTIGLKWKELELQEKQLLEEVKRRMQLATEQVQAEIDQMYLEHQSQKLREELQRRQEDLRRIDELRSQEINRRSMPPMHRNDSFNNSYPQSNNYFHPNSLPQGNYPYNDYPQGATYGNPPPNPLMQPNPPPDSIYTTNQVARGYGLGNNNPGRSGVGDDFHHQSHGFERKRPRY